MGMSYLVLPQTMGAGAPSRCRRSASAGVWAQGGADEAGDFLVAALGFFR